MRPSKSVETKAKLFEGVAAIASTFGSPARLKILQILAQAPRSVEFVAGITGESVANTSQHLRRLFAEGMVAVRKDGLSRIYRLGDESIALILESLFDLAEKISPASRLAQSTLIEGDVGKAVEFSSVIEELRNKKAVMLDVRDIYEVNESPVLGAVSLPMNMLKQQAKLLEKNKTYYIFCRGRSCEMATEGVRILRSLGLSAYRIKESPASIRRIIQPQQKKEIGV